MAILEVEFTELSGFLGDLSGVVDFDKDLPMNVFVGDRFLFWFFERPLLCFVDIFAELISKSVSSFKSGVFVKFSGCESLEGSCFTVDGRNVDKDALWLSKNSEDFFEGKVGYPIILCDGEFNWVAFESAHEELGVIAVNASTIKNEFYKYLDSNFISMDELAQLMAGSSKESVAAGKLYSSYGG